MSRMILVAAALSFALSASAWEAKSHDDPYGKLAHAVSSDLRIGDAAHYGGVTVYSVIRDGSARTSADWLTLEEAMATRAVVVTESAGGGSVPTLAFSNRGQVPVFGMGGELIRGGNQDRILTQDVILPPAQSTLVSVNCVEQSRWSQAGSGQFKYGGRAETALRQVVHIDDQTSTWHMVAALNARRGHTDSAYVGQTNLVAAQSDKYVRELMPALQKHRDAVGLVVAIGPRIIASDVYADPALFAKVRDEALEGYVLDALGKNGVPQWTLPPSSDQATWFLRDALASVEIDEERGVGGWEEELDGTVSRSYAFRRGAGQLVHLATYAE